MLKRIKNKIYTRVVDNLVTYLDDKNIELRSITTCYGKLDLEIKLLEKLLKKVMEKYNIRLLHKNIFGYSEIFDNTFGCIEFLLEYDYPSDCYPIISFLENIGKSTGWWGGGAKAAVSFDVGANKGMVTSYLSRISEKVYSFEPSKSTTEDARKNLLLNKVENVEWFDEALSNINDYQTFYDYGRTMSGINSLIEHGRCNTEQSYLVKTKTLDNFCKENGIDKIDILKIDTEGAENLVIEGAKGLIGSGSIGIIFFEVCKEFLKDGSLNYVEFLLESGYRLFNLGLEEVDRNRLEDSFCDDYVAINKEKVSEAWNLLQQYQSKLTESI